MRVAVCDNNLNFLEEIKAQLKKEEVIKAIDTYSDKNDFLEKVKDNKAYDLIFLNVNWAEQNPIGLELDRTFYSSMSHSFIVLLNDSDEECKNPGFLLDFKVTGYLLKPVSFDLLTQYIQMVKGIFDYDHVLFSINGKMIRIYTDEIIHIESHNHKIIVFTKNKIYSVYEKLSEVIKRLPDEFVQCHKSFVVNLKCITMTERKSVMMCNGKQIPISRTYQELFRNAFVQFHKE